jgi:glycosyltransferase involved in cell wall biosynthesis
MAQNLSDSRFSIVVPAYNAAATIAETIESVLAQGFSAWQLVITDDGSTDDTRAICDRYAERYPRVTVESQPNAGAGAAISAAIHRATGEFVVQLGADDLLLPEYCSATSAFIDANPGYDIYAANAYWLMPDGSRKLIYTQPRFERQHSLAVDDLLDEPLIYGTAAFRREWFDRVGGFRTEFHNEDYDFWLRVMLAGARHIYTPQALSLYRVNPGQKTEDGIRMRLEDIKVLRSAIDSGALTPEQTSHAEKTVALLERNVAFRKRVISLVGPRLARSVFALAHGAAWVVRPHRRTR